MTTHPANFIGGGKVSDRQMNDFYRTPVEATRALLQVERFPECIWEPACGDGAIVKVLYEHGYHDQYIFASDICDYGFPFSERDFFHTDKSTVDYWEIKSLITNPPYELRHSEFGRLRVEDWVQHGSNLGIEKMAFFLKTTALAGKKRTAIHQSSGLKVVYQFRERLNMTRDGREQEKSMIDFAWFVYEKGFTGDPIIKWIEQIK